jgi:hypothetical protein
MATITSDVFLDGGTARTAGEAWTCNGGILTVRTDTRWHANAPASMTGSLGSVSISATLGGGYYINATKTELSYVKGVTSSVQSQLNNKQKTITSGVAAPSGGIDGDIYLQYS